MSKTEIKSFAWPLVGHAKIVKYLQQNLFSDNLAHAFLFSGPSHLGKSTVAKFFINSLVCRNLHAHTGSVPCGTCECCRQVANNVHPDMYWLGRIVNEKTGKLNKNIGIEQIRQLQNMLSLGSFLNSYKVAVIDEAQALSQEAANSLLKTLEEPTPKTILILLASSPSLLPRTIISRCQVIKFLPVSTADIFAYLLSLKIERKKAKTLAALALGRPGLAINFAATADSFSDFQEEYKSFMALAAADLVTRFKIAGEIAAGNDPDELKEILLVWRRALRDLLLIKLAAQNFISNLPLAADLTALAERYSQEKIIGLINETNATRQFLGANVNSKLAIENLIINF